MASFLEGFFFAGVFFAAGFLGDAFFAAGFNAAFFFEGEGVFAGVFLGCDNLIIINQLPSFLYLSWQQ
ncbi:hypothetical protein [Photobacterium piscicola]|uniref:hypothetical protein n=1 Tax=Photobacterium piscicola TaxID=1378299 RepID=UPI0038D05989